jgi:type IV pilus assembly protein PilE
VNHDAKTQGPRAQRGFTLIEMMITVAIVGILAAIAYPAYTDSIRKGRRAEGRTALMNLMQQQERYLTQTGCYLAFAAEATGNVANCSGTSVLIPFKTNSGDGPTGTGAYKLAATACAPGISACVTLTAVPRNADPMAGTLSLNSVGVKTCTGTAASSPGVCW